VDAILLIVNTLEYTYMQIDRIYKYTMEFLRFHDYI